MKSFFSKVAAVTLVIGATVGTVQAENGSDRLMDFRLQQEALASQRADRDSGQRFAQMIEAQPTAAGPTTEQQSQWVQKPAPSYRSPIQQDRALNGSPK